MLSSHIRHHESETLLAAQVLSLMDSLVVRLIGALHTEDQSLKIADDRTASFAGTKPPRFYS